jgi:hypothetical protein
VNHEHHTFETERLQLAIFLHASGSLRFSGCELNGGGKVRFLFHDPLHTGDQLELEYEQGAPVAATALFASQKFLRRKMSEALGERRNGERYEYPR